jgi:hypothetical protein
MIVCFRQCHNSQNEAQDDDAGHDADDDVYDDSRYAMTGLKGEAVTDESSQRAKDSLVKATVRPALLLNGVSSRIKLLFRGVDVPLSSLMPDNQVTLLQNGEAYFTEIYSMRELKFMNTTRASCTPKRR